MFSNIIQLLRFQKWDFQDILTQRLTGQSPNHSFSIWLCKIFGNKNCTVLYDTPKFKFIGSKQEKLQRLTSEEKDIEKKRKASYTPLMFKDHVFQQG